MNLPTDYLRTFIAVADTKGFTKAGIQVNRSQYAVSMQIKRLEDEIDKPQYVRDSIDAGLIRCLDYYLLAATFRFLMPTFR